MRIVTAIISGRVQGVCYRAWTAEQAGRLGLSGWVRNRTDGTVEALFSGPDAEVNAMIEKCRRGPTWAHVTDIALSAAGAPDRPGFHMPPTA